MSVTSSARRTRPLRAAGLLLVLGIGLTLGGVATAGAADGDSADPAQSRVDLGAAAAFAVYATQKVQNASASVVDGEIGVDAGGTVEGFPPGRQTTGSIHRADDVALAARSAISSAYSDAATRTATSTLDTELGGRTLAAGVYSAGKLELTGTLTLTGDSDSVFVIQTQSTLVTAAASRVILADGVQSSNVFWQIGTSATLGTDTQFAGTILAHTSIQALHGTAVDGRLLARDELVTLDTVTVSTPACVEASPSASPAPGVTPAASPSPSAPACP